MVYNKVDFNPHYAASKTEEQFIREMQHQWPSMREHERNTTLSRVWQLSKEEVAKKQPVESVPVPTPALSEKKVEGKKADTKG